MERTLLTSTYIQLPDEVSAAQCFTCDYCSETFASRVDRTKHTATHFRNKSCQNCMKILICVNGDWYELHASLECCKENDVPNVDVEDIKAEQIDNSLDDIGLKSHPYDYDTDENRDDDEFQQAQIIPQEHIEAHPLPAIVKQKTAKPIARKLRARTKVAAKIEPSKVNVKKVAKIVKTPKIRKKVLFHVPFTDHRPKSTCICDICNKTLLHFASLRIHMTAHCRKERVTCDECHRTFATHVILKEHKKTHSKEKAYVCTYCGHGFHHLNNLKEHTNIHTGTKPYVCTWKVGNSECGKSFCRKTYLNNHTRIHTGHKPFKCNIVGCDRAYMYDVDLKRHKYSIHGIFTKKHICPICTKVFPENKLLKKHLMSHSMDCT